MTFRDLTIEESFPIAFQQDLLKKQSEHFVNNIITNGNIEAGYKNLPTELFSGTTAKPLMIDSKSPQFFVGTYIKNHWRIILSSIIIGSIIMYFGNRSREKKSRRKSIQKNIT